MQGQSLRKLRTAVITAAVVILSTAGPSAALTDGDTSVQKPPTTGAYAYGVYGPAQTGFPKFGPLYGGAGDPRLGGKVRRITSEFPNASRSDIYSKNGFWSSDGALMYHLSRTETKTIINATTGAAVAVPGDYKGFDGSFAPEDPAGGPYTWYFFTGTSLMSYSLSIATDGKPVIVAGPTPVKGFGAPLGGLGGSVDWIDNSGQYMVVNIGGVLKVWARGPDTIYEPPTAVNADTIVANGGWIGMSPNGNYVVVSTEDSTGSDQQISYAVDHAAGTLRAGKLFWTLCGGHGDLVSAADSRTYLVTFDCYGSRFPGSQDMPPAIYAVDVDPVQPVRATNNPDNPDDEAGRNDQRAANRKLLEVAWGDDGHFSGVSTGLLRDWAFISVESGEDTFARSLGATRKNPEWWTRPYMQEIVMVNVVTCQVVRVAHHRSRSVNANYYYQPRVSASWGDAQGASAAWLSNFGQVKKSKQPYAGYADVYATDITAADVPTATTTCLP